MSSYFEWRIRDLALRRVFMLLMFMNGVGCTDSGVQSGEMGSQPIDDFPAQGVDGTDGPVSAWPEQQPGLDDPNARIWHRAGQWYSEDPGGLSKYIQQLFVEFGVEELRPAQGILTPHAGLAASGSIAAQVWSRIEVPDLIIVLAPNHGDVGARAAIWPSGPWLAPGVAMKIDAVQSERLANALPGVTLDREAFNHVLAHPLEMQLPFISRIRPDAELVMIGFYDHERITYPGVDEGQIEEWAQVLADHIRSLESEGVNVLLVGTTDLSHYEPLSVNDPYDQEMMESIADLDVPGLRTVVESGEYTICGEVAVSIFMATLR
ncbi:MAG: AmmeMemoRadiSam system protein B, partial [Myxococcota bacterium]|nr:AmmeMemoRadiSam system protein B [Myxococcota bacterium]